LPFGAQRESFDAVEAKTKDDEWRALPEDADPVATCPACGSHAERNAHRCPSSDAAELTASHPYRVRVRKKKRNHSWGGQSRPKLIVVLIVVAIAVVTAWMLLDALTRKPVANKEVLASRPLTLAAAQQAEYQSASAKT